MWETGHKKISDLKLVLFAKYTKFFHLEIIYIKKGGGSKSKFSEKHATRTGHEVPVHNTGIECLASILKQLKMIAS
jgi:hypothetical protein